MTPPPPPDDRDLDPVSPDLDADELAVHAVLDDEASPEQRRRVARDPRLRARLDELRTTAAAVSTHPSLAEDDVLARIRATALAAADEPDDGPVEPDGARAPVEPVDSGGDAGAEIDGGPDQGEGDTERPTVVPLTPRPGRWLPPLPAVAAIVLVLLVVGVGLIATAGGGDDSADASRAGSASAEAQTESGADQGAASDAPPAGSTTVTAGSPTFASDDDLRVVLQTIDPATLDGLAPDATDPDSGAAPGTADDGTRCGDVLRASDAAIGPVQAARLVVVDDIPTIVVSTPVAATEAAPASTRLTVLEAASCVPRFAVQRDP